MAEAVAKRKPSLVVVQTEEQAVRQKEYYGENELQCPRIEVCKTADEASKLNFEEHGKVTILHEKADEIAQLAKEAGVEDGNIKSYTQKRPSLIVVQTEEKAERQEEYYDEKGLKCPQIEVCKSVDEAAKLNFENYGKVTILHEKADEIAELAKEAGIEDENIKSFTQNRPSLIVVQSEEQIEEQRSYYEKEELTCPRIEVCKTADEAAKLNFEEHGKITILHEKADEIAELAKEAGIEDENIKAFTYKRPALVIVHTEEQAEQQKKYFEEKGLHSPNIKVCETLEEAHKIDFSKYRKVSISNNSSPDELKLLVGKIESAGAEAKILSDHDKSLYLTHDTERAQRQEQLCKENSWKMPEIKVCKTIEEVKELDTSGYKDAKVVHPDYKNIKQHLKEQGLKVSGFAPSAAKKKSEIGIGE